MNAICPGATKRPRIDDVIEQQAQRRDISYDATNQQAFTDGAALGQMVEPGDVAEIVAYLASEYGEHMTAQDINVDAGTVWY